MKKLVLRLKGISSRACFYKVLRVVHMLAFVLAPAFAVG